MLTIFIFKSNALGMQYGMGTYIRELTQGLLNYTSHKIYEVAYHHQESKEFNTEEISTRYIKVNIPSPRQSAVEYYNFEKRYASSIAFLLAPIIVQNTDIIFHFNATDALSLMKKLKEFYSYPMVSVAHFAHWQLMFKGNKQKLAAININNPSTTEDKLLAKEKEYYELSNCVITVTQQMKTYLINQYGIDTNKIKHIPNGLEIPKVRKVSQAKLLRLKQAWGFEKKEKIILFTGRVDEAKGVLFLLEAFEIVAKENIQLRLVFAGSGIIPTVIKKTTSLHGKITYTEFITKDKLHELYQITDIAVFPSLYDQCPYSVLEIMMHQLPLVLSHISGLDEIYGEKHCLWIEPMYNDAGEISFLSKDIAAALETLLANPEQAISNALKAYAELSTKFSAKEMVKYIEKLYIQYYCQAVGQ